MKKLILLFAVLAFVACGKDEPEQPKNLNLYNPDKKVILHTVADFDVNSSKLKLFADKAPFNVADVFNEKRNIQIIGSKVKKDFWFSNEEYLNIPTALEDEYIYESGGIMGLSSYNLDTANNKIIFPIDEVVHEDGQLKFRLLSFTEYIVVELDYNYNKDTLGFIPLPTLWENQQRFKDYFKANQFDSIYNMLENDYKIVWADGATYLKHRDKVFKEYNKSYYDYK